jgi:hypothetical protein
MSSSASEDVVSRKSGTSSSKNEKPVPSIPPDLEKWSISLSPVTRKGGNGGVMGRRGVGWW